MIKPEDFFQIADLPTPLVELFEGVECVWDILTKIQPYLESLFPKQAAILGQIDPEATLVNPEYIYIGPGTHVETGAYVVGPAYIGENCEIRHGAYLRGSVIVGDRCVLGHASEFKNALLLPGSQAAHFAYVGDSILGNRVNLGAGTKLANMEMSSNQHKAETGHRPTVKIPLPGRPGPVDTGLIKIGAILGDDAQTGCNTVTNPGCLVGRGTLIYANTSLRKGYYEPGQIIKLHQTLQITSRIMSA